jgi:hypothetical protein
VADTWTTPSDERVRGLADEILSNPPYDAWNDLQYEGWLRFIEWLSSFFEWMDGIYLDSPLLYWAVLNGMLLLTAALLFHIVWAVRVALRAPPPAARTATLEESPLWAEEAGALASQGRFLEAAHRLALGSVQALVAEGHIELTRSDANRILRQRVLSAELPEELSSEFLRLLDRFEARWFRDRIEDPDLYQAWRDLHARIEALPVRAG